MLFFLNECHAHTLVLRLNSKEDINVSVQRIRDLTMKATAGYPFKLDFVNDRLAEKLKTERLLSVISNVFVGFAIFISCIGLLGLARYMAEQCSKELPFHFVISLF